MFLKVASGTLYFEYAADRYAEPKYSKENILKYSAFHGSKVGVLDQLIPPTKALKNKFEKYGRRDYWNLYSKDEKFILNDYFKRLSKYLSDEEFDEYCESFIGNLFAKLHASTILTHDSYDYDQLISGGITTVNEVYKNRIKENSYGDIITMNTKMLVHGEILSKKVEEASNDWGGLDAYRIQYAIKTILRAMIAGDVDECFPDYTLYLISKNFNAALLEEFFNCFQSEGVANYHINTKFIREVFKETDMPLAWSLEMNRV